MTLGFLRTNETARFWGRHVQLQVWRSGLWIAGWHSHRLYACWSIDWPNHSFGFDVEFEAGRR